MMTLADAATSLVTWRARGGAHDWVTFDQRSFWGSAIGPVEPGRVVMLAARTGAGKSFSLLHIMAHAEVPCLYLSLEDSALEVARRCVLFPSARLGEVMLATPRRRLGAVRAVIEEASQEVLPGPWLVAIDYIQLVAYTGEQAAWSSTDAVARTLDELQELGRELGFALLISSQVTRPAKPSKRDEAQEDPPLTIYDLKSSSSLEDASNVVLLLNRQGKRRVVVSVEKHKSAPTGARQTFERGEGGWLLPVTLDEELP